MKTVTWGVRTQNDISLDRLYLYDGVCELPSPRRELMT